MRALLLVASLLFCEYSFADLQPAQKDIPPISGKTNAGDKKDNPPNAKQEIIISLPSSVNLNFGGKLDVVSKSEQARTDPESSRWTDPITWFTLVIAFANIMLWIKTGGLVTEATKASNIAKEAADAAKKAAEVAESALLNVERPYLLVTISSFNIGNNITDKSGSFYCPVVTYSVSNHGKLPAIIDMVCAEIIHAPDEQLNDPISVEDTDTLLMERVIESNGWRQNLEFRNSTIDAAIVNSPNLTDHEIFFRIIIYYHGPFTKGHKTSGCWNVSFKYKDKLTLIQYGHDEYNYTN